MDGIGNVSSLRAGLDPLANVAGAGRSPAEAAARMEEVFSTMLVKEMRRALPEGFFGGGNAGDVYSGWLAAQVGKSLADRDALHLEEMLRHSIERKQLASNEEVLP